MANATDTQQQAEGPMNDEAAVEWLLAPESEEPEAETDEAPQHETEPEEAEAETDEPDEAENTDEDESEEADSDEDEDDDAEETDDDDDEEQPDARYTVKVDGEEKQVTLDELKRGYSGQAYIQQGMEANKQQQRALAEAAQAMQQERQALIQMAQQVSETGFVPAPQPPDPAMLNEDPIAYMEAEAKYRQDSHAYQQQQQQLQYHQQQQQQQQEMFRRQRLAEGIQKLQEMIPEFGDAKKAPELRDRLMKTAEQYQFSQQEVAQVEDPRALKILHDAMKWQELQSGKQAAKKPREEPRTVTKPQAKTRGGKRQKAQQQLQKAMKTQSDEDWVNVLLNP